MQKYQYFNQQLKHQGLGDEAIIALIDTLTPDPKNGLLCVMTEDGGLRHKLISTPAHLLDGRRLMHELEASQLLSTLGFKPDVSSETLFKDFFSRTERVSADHESPLTPQATDRFIHRFQRSPTQFFESLKQIKTEYDAPAVSLDPTKPDSPPCIRVSFADRYRDFHTQGIQGFKRS